MARTPVKKAVKPLKATIDRRQGPVRKSQDAPIIAICSVGLTGYQADDRLVAALRDLVSEHGEPGSDTDVKPLPSANGAFVEGAADPSLGKLRVVA